MEENTNKKEDSMTDEKPKDDMPKENNTPEASTNQPAPANNNMMMGIVLVVILVIIGAIGTFLFIANSGPKDLDSEEDVEEFLDTAEANFKDFSGVLKAEVRDEDGKTIQKFQVDLKNKVGYFQDDASGEEAYFSEDRAYFSESGTWYATSASDAGFDFDELTEMSDSSDNSDKEYQGLVDCPSDNGKQCYKIYDSEDDNTAYFNPKTGLPDTVENPDGTSMQYMFDTKGELEIPEDVIDNAEDFSFGFEDLLVDEMEGEDDYSEDAPDFENMTEEELEQYYDDLLKELEEEIESEIAE